ncbi:hypothetical protein AAMO2058_001604800 [Amorphochlora amoebiformis]
MVRMLGLGVGVGVVGPWGEIAETDGEESLWKAFQKSLASPVGTLLLIDDLDSHVPKGTTEAKSNAILRIARAYQNIDTRRNSPRISNFSEFRGSGGLVGVIGTSRGLREIELGLLDCFHHRIEINLPDVQSRSRIIQYYLPSVSKTESDDLGDRSAGLTCADISSACRDARGSGRKEGGVLSAMKRAIRERRANGSGRPYAATRCLVKWEDVAGIRKAKQALQELAVTPLTHPQVFSRLGINPPRGLLLYGPPGTGKTLLAKAVAGEAKARFLTANIPTLIHGEIGESVRAVRELFSQATRAAPCVVFLDELQAIFTRRTNAQASWANRTLSQLLIELDALRNKNIPIILLAATNAPQALDPALLRPGRLDRHVYVGPPATSEERLEVLEVVIKQMRKTADKNRKLAEKKSQPDKLAEKKSPPDKLGEKKKSNPDKLAENKSQDEKLSETRYRAEKLDLNRIASRTQGFTGADLTHLTQAAGLRAIRRALAEKQDLKSMTIRTQDFLDEIDRCKPSPAAVAMAEVLANWSA